MKFFKKLSFIFLSLFAQMGFCADLPAVVGKPLPAWKEGYLDIHHIHEGRGNATFMIFPDGTTLLYDMGDLVLSNQDSSDPKKYSGILPNVSKKPYEWVADYINRFSPEPGELDYLVISHYHFDHIGEWNPAEKIQPQGHYHLFGVTGLAEKIHIHTVIDRSYPNYDYHGDISNKISDYLNSPNDEYPYLLAHTLQDYKIFLRYQIKDHHMAVEKFQVGSHTQIHLVKQSYKDFDIRNIIGNGYVWTGKNNKVFHFIKYAKNDQSPAKTENDLSLGIRIDDGDFRYFTGGDMTGLLLNGKAIDSSAEAVAAPIIGQVDVATMNHHGFADAQSEIFVKELRPTVWIQQNWAASQTTLPMLMRTLGPHAYSSQRDLFALHRFQQNSAMDRYYKDMMGHIVVRVAPSGKQFWVILLTSDTINPVVKACYGPYKSSEK